MESGMVAESPCKQPFMALLVVLESAFPFQGRRWVKEYSWVGSAGCKITYLDAILGYPGVTVVIW